MFAEPAFQDLAASAPALEAITIETDYVHALFSLRTLTQSSLTHFSWNGTGWETSLGTIPITTLNQLTRITIECTYGFDASLWRENFMRPLSHLHHLSSLSISGDEVVFDCKDVHRMLGRIPAKLERFICHYLIDWEFEEVRAGLAKQTGLREVLLRTNGIAEVEVAALDPEVAARFREKRILDFWSTGDSWETPFNVEAKRVSEEMQIRKVRFEGLVKLVNAPWSNGP
ncbi:hypothetical protein HDV00_012560 [Rhizophlyctis rosea]|nr:hypothetical protein HDV00_012560 [Rhizophlyctis rosea]